MDAYLPDDMAGGGEIIEYGNGTWEQYFTDGSVLFGGPGGVLLLTDANGVVYDVTNKTLLNVAPAPILYADPGTITKIGDTFYKYTATKDANGVTIYTGQAVTASQAYQTQLAEDAKKNQLIFPLVAIGAALLIFGG